ncbi:SbcC/MukB-like Walker B domain-containing protein [Paractinoplanes atraurantiacus]|uniref:Putative exonuclease SbcCD, C subunit n=1 Tax=Paractinoplanes atraurantiacus TaxID=1036182 RepID=A0A285J0Q5_9ACTN|nr:SbcC/MukB-like Walker B domain-containing protein [Actinoplanes atraurantiacus]SNY53782.1 Putative exonuclease SbcCD, C subunit [Actinoplanes atraurantiacus]
MTLTPEATDAQLTAWRDAAAHGGLPSPERSRWQVLRAGCVGLWEFDAAEYWFADGRAQFVGANQSGKSTLMALTTLIMLSGSLDRQYIDTFGQSDKSFRYYVEPTDDARDRREATGSAHRGWAWVEYGRLGEDGPEFFTTLLYAQAKRGVSQLDPVWIICRGTARVRDGLTLAVGSSAVEPKELGGVEGLEVMRSGKRYAARIATDLFGFSDDDRFATVLEMLKVLRTPHLGQKLNPDWFTEQIRMSLPAVAESEVDKLADGWQQLEQLGRDRDHAVAARDAVGVYLARAWRPWADALLRARADDLLASDAAVCSALDSASSADVSLASARAELTEETGRSDELEAGVQRARAALTQLLRSAAYRDAAGRAQNAERMRRDAAAAAVAATTARRHLASTGEALQAAGAAHAEATGRLDLARTASSAAVTHAGAALRSSGLDAEGWAAEGDVDRIDAAVAARRSQVSALRKLTRAAATAVGRWQAESGTVNRLREEARARAAVAEDAATAVTDAVQQLSDDLERWAAGLPAAVPPVALRDDWVREVVSQTHAVRPREVLGGLLAREWLEPSVGPLTEEIAAVRAEARAAGLRADEAERSAEKLGEAGDPQPAAPSRWSRRSRPPFPGSDGAPLWRLVDPVDGVPAEVLDHVEAALDAAGLLDSWVTVDGVWSDDRDGAESVVAGAAGLAGGTLGFGAAGAGAPGVGVADVGAVGAGGAGLGSAGAGVAGVGVADPGAVGPGGGAGAAGARAVSVLTAVLQPAEDAGALGGTVARILGRIGYAAAGEPLGGDLVIAGDGRWRTPIAQGRAGRAAEGAELLGTAARAAARRRQIAALREQAATDREAGEELTRRAEELAARSAALRAAAAEAPGDADVVAAAISLAAANGERDRAETAHAVAAGKAAAAKGEADAATTAVTGYADEHGLPTSDEQLDAVGTALDSAALAAGSLRLALKDQDVAERAVASAVTGVEAAEAAQSAAATAVDEAATAAAKLEAEAGEAEASVSLDDREQFARSAELEEQIRELDTSIAASRQRGLSLAAAASTAQGEAQRRQDAVATAIADREAAARAWWIPVDAGIAAARGIGNGDHRERTLEEALAQARAAVDAVRPPSWPDNAGDRDRRVDTALQRALRGAMTELQTLLEASGGRSVIVSEADEAHPLPAITLVVDAAGTPLDPPGAVERLDQAVAELSATHDEKLHQMYAELLSSTFIDHLADRMTRVVTLLTTVNEVLLRHPTGANKTVLQIRRRPAEGQQHGFNLLRALEEGRIESDSAQEQIRLFLGDRLREAQDSGVIGTDEWVKHLTGLLDYRAWFDCVCYYRVEGGDWKPLTKQVHGVDSGGGKVVTLLQPLLATLVALYSRSADAPRPLWLDEAFEGVDPANRATMLRLLVDFDLDFLLAGPAPLVAAAQVPSAAVWTVSRAPAPLAGVDLSLMLWAGRTLEAVPVADVAATVLAPRRPVDDPDRPDLFADLTQGAGGGSSI